MAKHRSRWTERLDVIDLVCEAYVGVDGGRRIFIWTDKSGVTWQGNIEAFLEHCIERFELIGETVTTSQLHQLLRDLGAPARNYTETRQRTGEQDGKFQAAQPESWIIHGPVEGGDPRD